MTDKKDKIIIKSTNQSGGITAHTVNINTGPRQMTNELGDQIKSNVPADATLTVTTAMDDESLNFGIQIYKWLKSNGYPYAKGVNSAMWVNPVIGLELGKKNDKEFELRVGAKG